MAGLVWIITTSLVKSKETAPPPVSAFTSYEERRRDYEQGIPSVLRQAHDTDTVFITENNGNTESFLDSFGVRVHYTNTQQLMFNENRGKKEITDIVSCLNTYEVPDDTMVIKVTGRYRVETSRFPDLVRANLDKEVVYSPTNMFKFKQVPPQPFPDCILGMIAMKARHWRAIPIETIQQRIPTEWTVAKYIVDTIPPEMRVTLDTLELSIKDDGTKQYYLV